MLVSMLMRRNPVGHGVGSEGRDMLSVCRYVGRKICCIFVCVVTKVNDGHHRIEVRIFRSLRLLRSRLEALPAGVSPLGKQPTKFGLAPLLWAITFWFTFEGKDMHASHCSNHYKSSNYSANVVMIPPCSDASPL